eukprot:scaffold8347_cov88-Skeletonema_marinoi.AAC.4
MGASDSFELVLRISDRSWWSRSRVSSLWYRGVHGGKGCASSQVKKRGAGKERKRRSDQTGRRVGKSVGG